jgi:hypothetical protein
MWHALCHESPKILGRRFLQLKEADFESEIGFLSIKNIDFCFILVLQSFPKADGN